VALRPQLSPGVPLYRLEWIYSRKCPPSRQGGEVEMWCGQLSHYTKLGLTHLQFRMVPPAELGYELPASYSGR
jgi:hypothetical protein